MLCNLFTRTGLHSSNFFPLLSSVHLILSIFSHFFILKTQTVLLTSFFSVLSLASFSHHFTDILSHVLSCHHLFLILSLTPLPTHFSIPRFILFFSSHSPVCSFIVQCSPSQEEGISQGNITPLCDTFFP